MKNLYMYCSLHTALSIWHSKPGLLFLQRAVLLLNVINSTDNQIAPLFNRYLYDQTNTLIGFGIKYMATANCFNTFQHIENTYSTFLCDFPDIKSPSEVLYRYFSELFIKRNSNCNCFCISVFLTVSDKFLYNAQ